MATPTILQVIDWLITKDAGPFFGGFINKDLDQCVGVYDRPNGRDQPAAIGGSGYGVKSLTVLVHWSNDSDVCEKKAKQLIDYFRSAGTTEVIGDTTGWFTAQRDPVGIGRDARGIFERTFDVEVYYRR